MTLKILDEVKSPEDSRTPSPIPDISTPKIEFPIVALSPAIKTPPTKAKVRAIQAIPYVVKGIISASIVYMLLVVIKGTIGLVSLGMLSNPIGWGICLGLLVLMLGFALYSRYKRGCAAKAIEPFLMDLERARVANIPNKVLDANDICSEMNPRLPRYKNEVKKFATQVASLSKKAKSVKDNPKPHGMEGLRDDLSAILRTPVYQTFKYDDVDAIEYLQELSLAFIEGDGETAIAKYAEKQQIGNTEECDQLVAAIEKELRKPEHFKRNTPRQKAEWAAHHFDSIIHSWHSNEDGLGYKANGDNASYRGFKIRELGKEMQFYYSPSPTGDLIFEHGILPAYAKKGISEVRFGYQSARKKAELERNQELIRLAKKYPEQLTAVIMDFDAMHHKKGTEIGKQVMAGSPVDFESVDTFLGEFEKNLNIYRNDETNWHKFGYYIPKTALSDENLTKAFKIARQVKTILEGTFGWDLIDAVERKNVLKLATESILHLAILKQKNPDKVAGSCKEDIDRGPQHNVLMRIFSGFLADDDGAAVLLDEGPKLVAGLVARGRHTPQQRDPLDSRTKILIDLLFCIDKGARKKIAEELKNLTK